MEIGILLSLVGLVAAVLATGYVMRARSARKRDDKVADITSPTPTSSRYPADEYQALCREYNLPPGATDRDISDAIEVRWQASRRRGLGLPETASEAEVRAAVAASYGLPADCSDKELSAAIEVRWQAMRRRNHGLPETASEAEVRKAVAAS